MGLHPRLGRMIMTAAERGWLATAAVAAAILEEGDPIGGDDPDFRDRIAAWSAWSRGRARRLCRKGRPAASTRRSGGSSAWRGQSNERSGQLISTRNSPGNCSSWHTRTGRRAEPPGALFPGGSWLPGGGRGLAGALGNVEFLAAAELDGGETDARIFLAAPITIGDLESGLAGQPGVEHLVEWEGWSPATHGHRCVWENLSLRETRGTCRQRTKSASKCIRTNCPRRT